MGAGQKPASALISTLRIFAATLFVSAFLLFMCQPMVGKMLLPYLGGAAAVWTTCVLFFQCMLLLGYVYAHLLGHIADVRKQIVIHAMVLLLPLAFLPIHFAIVSTNSLSQHPARQLLALLITTTALPFFVVSTTAPLLQNWFSLTSHSASSDPYFLYSASNAGSLLALAAYPFLIEPRIGTLTQTRWWSGGYVLLIGMIVLSVVLVHKQERAVIDRPYSEPADWKRRVYWTAAAFVPSGLMLAVTNHIAANIGSVPFLWLVPLAIYLLTFILAFGRRIRISSKTVATWLPLILLALFPLVAAGVIAPPGVNWILIAAHLVLLFAGALMCHTRLAESRPGVRQLTEFYFWIAFGGVLGGFFTATLAPTIFNTVLEYPLLVAALPFFRGGKFRVSDFWISLAIAMGIFVTWAIFRTAHLDSNTEAVALAHTVLLFIGYKLIKDNSRFAWTFLVLILTYTFILPGYIEGADRIYAGRNFFGVKKVLDDPNAHLRKLLHGDTIHGIESTEATRTGQPLSYYFPGGSVSDVIDMMRLRGTSQRFAVLGLGAGTMAAFADANHDVTFYEIDPEIEPVARRYFTFLTHCGSQCKVVIGDGRLELARENDATFDLILLDAFSSDSVPTHLVSREALGMYLSKLKPDGVLLFHVSNRYLNVEKLVSALVVDAGLVALSRFDDAGELRRLGKSSANHLVAARRLEDIRMLASRAGWQHVSRPPNFETWTDDYSNLLSVIRWN